MATVAKEKYNDGTVTITEVRGALGPMTIPELKALRETLANHALGFRPLEENKPVIEKFDRYLSAVIENETTAGNRVL